VKKFQITGFKDPVLAARLITIGIYPGRILKIIRKALFGGAYYIEIEGSHYALREKEMELIEMVEIEAEHHE
jgi:Fe2+ transport system protein FeoA